MVVIVDVCAFRYTCLKCLEDVWNIIVMTNHNLQKSTYNQFVNTNMKIHKEVCYHMINGNCTHTSTHIMLENANHFLFHSQFLGGPQLNLWKGIRGKKIRSIPHSKLKYKTFVCFAYIRMTTITPTSSSHKLFENEKLDSTNGKRPVLAVCEGLF